MKAVLLITLCIASAIAVDKYQMAWANFKTTYEKVYTSGVDEANRFKIFKNNFDFIENFNNNQHNQTFQVGINKFADLTNEEFRAIYLGTVPQKRAVRDVARASAEALPDSWDWAKQGAVTPVKNQGQCGSCWSFSTTGSVEGCTYIATKHLVSLSEQDLMDCSTAEGNQGCNGGLMDDAFEYIIKNHGVDTETCYPYKATDGSCHYSKSCCGATIKGYKDVQSGSESALQTAVHTTPVSVAIDASQSSFQFYKSGVYNEPACSSTQLDHGVLAVGWGVSGSHDYWIVKNSWGTDWGINGYIWMSRNKKNQCGIATMASYPTGCGQC